MIYQTPKQVELVQDISSKQRLCYSIDASGNFAYPLKVNNNINGHLFMYCVCTWIKNYKKIIPVTQMLSEEHTTSKIKDWLKHLNEATNIKPEECVMDGSLALLNAVALAFNNCSLQENLLANHLFLTGESLELKHCFIRDDKNHFIKPFIDMKCWEVGNSKNKREFWTHCLGYCMKITNINVIKETFINMYVVAQSPFCDRNSECASSMKDLLKKIKTFDINAVNKIMSDDTDNSNQDSIAESSQPLPNSLTKFIDNDIIDKAKNKLDATNSVTSVLNTYYCKELLPILRTIFMRYTTFTKVMVEPYASDQTEGTSCRSEGLFNILKKELGRKTVPILVLEHLDFIDGQLNIAKAALDKQRNVTQCALKLKVKGIFF